MPKRISGFWSIWADNRIMGEWTLEFQGTKDECMTYLALTNNGTESRLWDFAILRPL